jgi:hypothetical protein
VSESALPFSRLDEVVNVALRACTYPYGAGQPGVGVQITLESHLLRQVMATRLPAEPARALALAILDAVDPGGCVCDLIDTSLAGGPPSYTRGRSNGCLVHPESPDWQRLDVEARRKAREA